MTQVKTFRAATMEKALNIVRGELGADAVIHDTRQVSRRRFLPWLRLKEEVEITASMSTADGSPPRSAEGPTAASFSGQHSGPNSQRHSHGAGGLLDRTVGAVGAIGAVGAVGAALDEMDSDSSTTGSGRADDTEHSRWNPPHGNGNGNARSAARDANPAVAGVANGSANELTTKLDSIQRMVEQLGHSRHSHDSQEVPDELFHLYTDLIESEVEDDVARNLVSTLKKNCSPEQLRDSATAQALLTAMVESEINCAGPISPTPGRRKVVALVGPTGVGKTTTIAKLAANFRLRDGIRMGLVTVDTYRIAAVEQLRTYAEIIDLPMHVVTSPPEMRRTMDQLTGLDLVLIDTAGRSPRDDLQIQELKSLLAEAQVDEAHLVLSTTASLRALQATAEKFAAARTTSMILTKLDEAAGMGPLLSVSRNVGLPISYLTTGQDVPEDIEPAHAGRMARLVLGQDRLF